MARETAANTPSPSTKRPTPCRWKAATSTTPRLTRFVYQSPTTPRQTFDYDMATRERTLRKTQEIPSGHDPARYVARRLMATAADGERGADHRPDAEGHAARRLRAPAALRLRLLRHRHGAQLLDPQSQPRRPRLDLGHRLRARRLGQGLGLVPGRPQGVQEGQHLHRLHRLRRAPGRQRLWRQGQHGRLWRLGRRAADGRDRQYAAGPLGRDHRRRALRRCAQHHERHHPAPDPAGMARVGQSAGGRGRLRPDRRLQPL